MYFLIHPYTGFYLVVVDTLNSFLLVTSIEVLYEVQMCAAVAFCRLTVHALLLCPIASKHEVSCMIE